MSESQALVPAPAWRRGSAAPPLLLAGSILLYVGVAFWTGQTKMLETDGVIGLLERMVALGIVALGQTFAIIAGSIDLSVANMISVAAVLASFIMHGRADMMLAAVLVVLAVSALVGVVNGAIISRLQVNPFIATLGSSCRVCSPQVSPILPDRCRASSRPSPTARSASSPIRSRRCSCSPLWPRSSSGPRVLARISTRSAETRRGRGSRAYARTSSRPGRTSCAASPPS